MGLLSLLADLTVTLLLALLRLLLYVIPRVSLLALGAVGGSLLAQKAATSRARRQYRADALQSLASASPAEVLRLLGGVELPPWIKDSTFERIAWLNTLLRQLWPHLDAAIARKVLDATSAALAGGVGMGMNVALTHFSLGARPLTLCGIRALGDPGATDTPDSCVLDIDVRLASTEPNAVVTISGGVFAATPLTLELAALQVHATLRVSFRLLSAKLPPFDAITVSLLHTPFLDFSLRALSGDIMAIPGLEATVARAVRGAVSAYVWPLRMAIPLTEEAAEDASLHPRARGVLLVRLLRARNLPATDLSSMSTDPYAKLYIVGQPQTFVETSHKQRTRKPVFNLKDGVVPVTDIRAQSLALEMWDSNAFEADQLVSTALLPLAEALGLNEDPGSDAAGRTFNAWVPLTRADVGLGDITSHLSTIGSGVRSMVRLGAAPPLKEGGSGGDAYIAFTFVPFARPGVPPIKLPPGWRLPSPSPAILSIRLLRARSLHLPASFRGPAHPFITARLGKSVLKSAPGRGTSPGWLDEVLTFTNLDLLSDTPSALLRLQLTVSAGKLHAGAIPGVSAVTGALGGAVSGAAGLVSGSVAALTLGNVDLGAQTGGSPESQMKLHSRTGGLLGRKQRSAAEVEAEGEAPPEEQSDAAFCGRIEPITLAEIQKACTLAGGPVTFTRPLREVPTGDVTFIAELHTFNAEEADAAAADASEDALPTAASEIDLPAVGGEGAPAESAVSALRRAAAEEEAQADADAEAEEAAAQRVGCLGCVARLPRCGSHRRRHHR